ANADPRQPRAQLSIFPDAEREIEVTGLKNEATLDAEIAGHEIGLIADVAGFQAALRKKEYGSVYEERQRALADVLGTAKLAKHRPALARFATMECQVLDKQVRSGDGVVVAEQKKLSVRGFHSHTTRCACSLIGLTEMANRERKREIARDLC